MRKSKRICPWRAGHFKRDGSLFIAGVLTCLLIFFPLSCFAGETFPVRYNAREEGRAAEIRRQGNRGTCWALSAVSALEAALLPGVHEVFSAEHLITQNGFTGSEEEGGDDKMIMAYLSGWRGPIFEAELPYRINSSTEWIQEHGSDVEGQESDVSSLPACAWHVQGMRCLEQPSLSLIKELVLQCGAVQTSLYMDRQTVSVSETCYNPDTSAYYVPDAHTPTHDVLIVGWDDAFPKDAFLETPTADGAYICQNTWGTDFGDEGIFYVSYEDAVIAKTGLAYTEIVPSDTYDTIYQTDLCGWQGKQGYEKETCWFANVYTAQQEEHLKAVGFYTTGEHSSYEVWAVENFASVVSFDDRVKLTEGMLEGMGYVTIPLPEEIPLTEGERFAVIVKIRTEGTGKPVAVELKKDAYTQNVTLDGKDGYLSLTGEVWEHTEEKFGTNVCLKAYAGK